MTDGPADNRMHHLRRDLCRRLQDEPPPGHPRMGNLQFRLVQYQIIVEQQIDIDGPRTPAWGTRLRVAEPAERVFTFLTRLQ